MSDRWGRGRIWRSSDCRHYPPSWAEFLCPGGESNLSVAGNFAWIRYFHFESVPPCSVMAISFLRWPFVPRFALFRRGLFLRVLRAQNLTWDLPHFSPHFVAIVYLNWPFVPRFLLFLGGFCLRILRISDYTQEWRQNLAAGVGL